MKTYNKNFLLIIFLCFSLFSYGQRHKKPQNLPRYDFKKIHFGFTVGINSLNFNLAKNDDFLNNFNIIIEEVNQYGNAISDKPRITVLNKIDALGEDERKFYKESLAKIIDEPVFMISAVSGEGIENLLRAIRIEVDKGKASIFEEEQGSLKWHP